MNKRFSIIIPCFNNEKYISQCLDSVLCQTYTNYEIIIIDDGSYDNTAKILGEYSKKYNAIQVFKQENQGAGIARNMGVIRANGDFIIFLDSDDFWLTNDFLDRISNSIKDDTECLLFSYTSFFEYNQKIGDSLRINTRIQQDNKLMLFSTLTMNNIFTISPVMKVIKRESLIKNNLFFKNIRLYEDLDWGLNLYRKLNNFVFLDYPQYACRSHENSISRNKNNIMEKSYCLLEIIENYYNQMFDSKELIDRFLLGYLAFEYSILLGFISSIEVSHKKSIIKRMKKMSKLLNYANNRKTKLCNIMIKCLGYNISSLMFGGYLKYAKKN